MKRSLFSQHFSSLKPDILIESHCEVSIESNHIYFIIKTDLWKVKGFLSGSGSLLFADSAVMENCDSTSRDKRQRGRRRRIGG